MKLATRGALWTWLVTIAGWTQVTFAQSNCRLTIEDASTKTPLSDAIVRVVPLSPATQVKAQILFTDKDGLTQFVYETPVLVTISYLGYETKLDTFLEGNARTISMVKKYANMEDVVVTGQYLPNSSKSSVYDIKVISQKDFRERGANNLREALLGNLNIDMTQDAIYGTGISLQGISGEAVKIMVDGIPVVGRLDGKLDLSQISLSNIDRVEIVKGPLSVVYGTDAMGGVINLITKGNQKEKYNINLKGYYESVGQYNVELNGGLSLGKSQFYASVGRNFFDGFSVIDTSRHKEWRPKEQYMADAKYTFTSARFRINMTGSFFRELLLDRGNLRPGTTYAFDQSVLTFRPRATVAMLVPVKELSQVDILLGYSGFIRYLNNYLKDLNTLRETLRADEMQDTSLYHQITARATYTLSTANKKVSFQFGLDMNQEYSIQERIINGQQEVGDYAAFASMRWKPLQQLDIQSSFRFSYNTKFSTPFIPSLNIKYDATKFMTLRASYGLGYRAPSLKELYLEFKDSNHDLNGNPNLKAEQGHNGQISLDFQWNKNDHQFKCTNTAFFNRIENKIDFAVTNAYTSPITFTYFNMKMYQTIGSEHQLSYNWQRVSAGMGAMYIAYRVDNSNKPNDRATLFSPDVFANVSYKIPKAEVGILVTYKYTGKKLLYSINNSIQAGTRHAFHSLDVALTRDFWKHRIQLTIGGKNLLNVTNVTAQNVSGTGHNFNSNNASINWGRTFFMSLQLHFSK